jgi:hypothetical protein
MLLMRAFFSGVISPAEYSVKEFFAVLFGQRPLDQRMFLPFDIGGDPFGGSEKTPITTVERRAKDPSGRN